MASDADIDVKTGVLHEFATGGGTGGVDMDLEQVKGHITKTGCAGTNLAGCVQFRLDDEQSTTAMMQTLTRARQLIYGLRSGAQEMAETFDGTEAEVTETLRRVGGIDGISPHQTGLPVVAPDLQLAQEVNANRPN